jgi:hypothetical protein
MRWFDASPRRATPKGHSLHHLHSTASRGSPTATPLRARGAHKIMNFIEVYDRTAKPYRWTYDGTPLKAA